jgi:hypothetical protein
LKATLNTFFFNQFLQITILTTCGPQKASIGASGMFVDSFSCNEKESTLTMAEAPFYNSHCFLERNGTPKENWQLARHTCAHPQILRKGDIGIEASAESIK